MVFTTVLDNYFIVIFCTQIENNRPLNVTKSVFLECFFRPNNDGFWGQNKSKWFKNIVFQTFLRIGLLFFSDALNAGRSIEVSLVFFSTRNCLSN